MRQNSNFWKLASIASKLSSALAIFVLTLLPTLAQAQTADLQALQNGPTNVNSGATFLYTITVTNAGTSAASNVVVLDHVPTNLTVSAISPGGSLSGNTVTWTNSVPLSVVGGTHPNSIVVGGYPSDDGQQAMGTYTYNAARGKFELQGDTNIVIRPAGSNWQIYDEGEDFYFFWSTNLISASWTVASDGSSPPPITYYATNTGFQAYTLTVVAPTNGVFTNTASVSSSTADAVPSNNSSQIVTRVATPSGDVFPAFLESGFTVTVPTNTLGYQPTPTNEIGNNAVYSINGQIFTNSANGVIQTVAGGFDGTSDKSTPWKTLTELLAAYQNGCPEAKIRSLYDASSQPFLDSIYSNPSNVSNFQGYGASIHGMQALICFDEGGGVTAIVSMNDSDSATDVTPFHFTLSGGAYLLSTFDGSAMTANISSFLNSHSPGDLLQ